jgi:HK97 family phage major capsid protein
MTFPNASRALRGPLRAEASGEQQQLFNQINATLGDMRTRLQARLEGCEETVQNLTDSMSAMQQSINVDGITPLAGGSNSWGDQVLASEELSTLRNAAGRAKVQIPLAPRAEITSVSTGAGPLIRPDRDDRVVGLPRRRLTIRALLGSATTDSNLIEYARQTTRDNQAATVAEGALKPESDLGFEIKQAKVATLAHWLKTSRQAMDDAGQLRSIIDSELRYGLAVVEENQLLLGDGVGSNMLGLIPQATTYDNTGEPTTPNKFDVLLNAIAQAEAANLPATGIVVNNIDWMRLQSLKDSQERYLGDGPMGSGMPGAWGIDVVPSPAMAAGKFLVGAFADAATVYDRMNPIVLLSTEDGDNFRRNMVTVLCEERLALAVRRPEALIYGDYSAAAG